MLTLLAQNNSTGLPLGKVVIYGIVAVLFFSSIIKNALKEKKKKSRRAEAGHREADGAGGAEAGGRPSLDEIAARRRQQLQAMADQRRGQAAPTQAVVGRDGGGGGGGRNLSMAERIAQARAQPPSTDRGGSRSPSPRSGSTGVKGQNLKQQHRDRALKQQMAQREQLRRDAVAQRQRDIQQANARRQRAQAQARPTSPSAPPPVQPIQRPTSAPITHGIGDGPHGEVHRMVTNADAPAKRKKGRHLSASAEAQRRVAAEDPQHQKAAATLLDFDKLTRADLRRAFIFKEVLDRPLSERDPLAQFNPPQA